MLGLISNPDGCRSRCAWGDVGTGKIEEDGRIGTTASAGGQPADGVHPEPAVVARVAVVLGDEPFWISGLAPESFKIRTPRPGGVGSEGHGATSTHLLDGQQDIALDALGGIVRIGQHLCTGLGSFHSVNAMEGRKFLSPDFARLFGIGPDGYDGMGPRGSGNLRQKVFFRRVEGALHGDRDDAVEEGLVVAAAPEGRVAADHEESTAELLDQSCHVGQLERTEGVAPNVAVDDHIVVQQSGEIFWEALGGMVDWVDALARVWIGIHRIEVLPVVAELPIERGYLNARVALQGVFEVLPFGLRALVILWSSLHVNHSQRGIHHL